MDIDIKPLSTGWWQLKGEGPENWAQVPHWPCSEDIIREHAFPGASKLFLRAASELAHQEGER